ncbi:MAG TPA: TonB-dependent receptor [Caulobacteraceae bacterium]|jgi:outer membrane receptor protein involved in Fe transport|nr:TonB-dependent receptor [Caulobacteraceae bacterium]
MTKRLVIALLSGVSAVGLATAAFAQAADPAEAGQVASVVVTATRIQTNGYTQPTPVTVASVAELLQTTPSNIPDALNKLPQFSGSAQGAGNGNGSGPQSIFTGNFLNLRNMGAIRTLILLDGRRVPSTAGNGSVDTNTLPQMLVQRVDVVTAGASAVYGSDAVTGVVNFVLDSRYTGLRMQVQDGISDRGDVPSFKFGIAGGAKVFGDRGHLIFSAEHYQNAGLKTIEARDYTSPIYIYEGAGTAQNPYRLTSDARIATTAYGGLVATGPFAGQQFVGSGVLAPFNPGTPTATGGISVGGDGTYLYNAVMSSPLRSDQVFGRFEYEFDGNTVGFMQLNWTEGGNFNVHRSNQPSVALTIFSGNPYLPASAQAALTGANAPSFVMNRYPRDLTLGSSLTQLTGALDFTTGLKGKLFGEYRWDAYYTHGEARVRSRRNNNINWVKFYAALDAVKDSSGNIVCRVTVTNPGLYPGCAPIDMFGQLNQSAAALDYVYDDTNFQVLNKMDDFAASLSGDLLQAWAGPLSVAANFEYRQQSIAQTSTADPNQALNLTGVRLGALPRSVYVFDLLAPQYGQNSVWEVSGEAALPLLKDIRAVKRLDMTGAVRYTQYSSSGPATTWKVGLNYAPFDDLRFRYTESRDIRAPTLNDLYSGATIAGVTVNDPHTGRTGNTSLLGAGNPDLAPEISRTTTLGAVYRPSWVPRFQMSVDYFNIDINNAIGTLGGNSPAVLQECEVSGGASPLCALIVRPLPFSDRSAANFPTSVRSTNLNVASQFTHGIDVEASYRFALADLAANLPGTIDLRLLYTYQPVLKSRSFPSSPVVNAAGTVDPAANRASLTAGYQAGPFSLRWQAVYSGKMKRTGNPLQFYADPALPASIVHNINAAYRFKVAGHDLQASLAVSNLFDKAPRIAPLAGAAGTPGNNPSVAVADDLIGRYFTFGLRAEY